MKAKHTPGPWFVDEPASFMQTRVMTRDGHGFPHQIALCEEPKHSVATANARLIAAAPALLEALEGLRTRESPDCWCPADHKHGRAIRAGEHTNECAIAQAAIAAARGES